MDAAVAISQQQHHAEPREPALELDRVKIFMVIVTVTIDNLLNYNYNYCDTHSPWRRPLPMYVALEPLIQ